MLATKRCELDKLSTLIPADTALASDSSRSELVVKSTRMSSHKRIIHEGANQLFQAMDLSTAQTAAPEVRSPPRSAATSARSHDSQRAEDWTHDHWVLASQQ